MKKVMMPAVILVLLSVLLLGLGCSHGPYKARADKKKALEHKETLTLMDDDLDDWLRIDAQKADYLPDGRLQAYCEIRNHAGKDIVIQVQTVFKDAENLALDDMTNWETVLIPSGAIHYYKATSMTAQARRYGIRIKLGGQEDD